MEAPAGLGKTRLLQAAREKAQRAGMEVLCCRGSELERDFPFALVRQLLEPVMHSASEEERAELLDGAAALAGSVLGVAPAAAGSGGEVLFDPSFSILNALYWLTSNITERRPVLMCMDDAHWADAPSLRFAIFLSPRLEDLPLLVFVAARPAEPGAEVGLLAVLAADPAARTLRPDPLSRAAVAELVRAQLAPHAVDSFCVACHQASGGNPFMLSELLGELGANGTVGAPGDIPRVGDVAPATVKRSVLMRLGRLPEPAPRLARAVAVLGDGAELREAAVLAVVDTAAAAAAADALAAAGILEPGRPLRFLHPLVRSAVHTELASAEKAAAHKQAAKLLEEQGAEPERIAIHLLATDPDSDPEVVATLDVAARRALERAAPEAALAYLRRALAEPPPVSARPSLLRGLVTASFRVGEQATLEALLESGALEELTANPNSFLESAVELSFALFSRDRVEQSAALLDRAMSAAATAGDHGLVVRLESFRVMWTRLPPKEALAGLARYKDRIEPDTAGERVLLGMQALWGLLTGEPRATVVDLAQRALADGRIWTEQSENLLPTTVTSVLLWTDELDAAERAIDRNLSTSRARGAALGIAAAAYSRADLAYLRGNVAQAEADARAAVEASRQGGFPLAYPMWTARLIEILIERDELEAAEDELAAFRATASMDDFWHLPLLLSRARLRLAQGRPADALHDLHTAGEIAERDGIQARHSPGGSYVALALARVGEADGARQAAEHELADARAWGLPRRIGIALRTLGLIMGHEAGLTLLRDALTVLESSPAELELAQARADYGAALRRAGRRVDARDPLRRALDFADRVGATALARRSREELAATGARPRRLALTGVEALTASERRVAQMAAEGHRNREIAQELFVSTKTVETHLAHAYEKLGIHSRRELPEALAQRVPAER